MELYEIIKLQTQFDEAHGWEIPPLKSKAFIESLSDDVLGLIGEVGEFANIAKKIKLDLKTLNEDSTDKYLGAMKEECIDMFIYFIRISAHIGIDIEKEYLKKLSINEKRFTKYEK